MIRPAPRVALLVLLLLDACLFCAWFLGIFAIGDESARFAAWVGTGAIAAIGLLAFIRPAVVPLALTRGIAVVACGALAVTWAFGTAFSHFESGISAESRLMMNVLAFGTLLVQVGIFVAAHFVERPGMGVTLASTAGGAFAVYLGGLLFLAAADIAWKFIDYGITAPRFEADSVMQESVARVQACALDHAHRYPDRGFPPDLAAIGPAPGTGCLEPAIARGRKGRVRITYEPEPHDGAGLVKNFRVVARADAGVHGEPKLAYGDSAGFLRSGFATDDSATLRVVGGSLEVVRVVRACAGVYRQRHPAEGYPPSAAAFARLQEEVGERGAALLGCNPWRVPLRTASSVTVGAYRLSYLAAQSAGGPVMDYVVELRPTTYAVYGLRSYRVTARGPVRMTREDRSATDEDAIVPPCEYDLAEFLCAPLPGGVAPAAALDAADTARQGMPFRVVVRDLRPAPEQDPPYQVSIECNSKIMRDWEPPPASKTFAFPLVWDCIIPANQHPAWSDRALVRAWVRDRAGSVVLLTDTVRLVGTAAR